MARSGFALRFGYVRWLSHLQRGEPPAYAEIGREVGKAAGGEPLTGQAISGWAKRDEATDSRRNNKALADYFDVSELWLIDGEGEAPRPELWKVWSDERRRRSRAVSLVDPSAFVAVPRSKPASKRKTK